MFHARIQNQQERQSRVDKELSHFGCDYTVMMYLLKQREKERAYKLESNEITKSQLESNETDLNSIEKIVNGKFRCTALWNMLNQ